MVRGGGDGVGMTCSLKFLIAILLGCVMQASALHAQTVLAANEKVVAAFSLDTAGHPAQALAAAVELLASGTLGRMEQIDTLDLEGICYLELDQMDKAVHALEAAQALLEPGDTQQQAAILDNLGRIYAARENYEVASHLYQRSFQLFEAISSHEGMVRVANNQAEVALSQKKNRQARKYLERADHEAAQAHTLDLDDLASLESMRGWLALNEGDARGGLGAYQRALRIWTEAHGEQHPLTHGGWCWWGRCRRSTGRRKRGREPWRKG